jgi:WD40 repeat protein
MAHSQALSWDEHLLAYPSTNGSYVVWNIAANRLQSVLKEFTGYPSAVTFSRDGRLLATGTAQATARVWDIATGQPVTPPLVGHLSAVLKLRFSPDGKTLMSYGQDMTCRLWHVATGQEMMAGLPLNRLLLENFWMNVLTEGGNAILEPDGENRFRLVRLPTLAEIQELERRP